MSMPRSLIAAMAAGLTSNPGSEPPTRRPRPRRSGAGRSQNGVPFAPDGGLVRRNRGWRTARRHAGAVPRTAFGRRTRRKHRPEDTSARCSFCSKPGNDERRLVTGPDVWISADCVALCGEILAQPADTRSTQRVAKQRVGRRMGCSAP
ncbi:ClpX C4-type zinc finger protein [Streptomyces mirabilis]|uniref:ClpX C4-type zinc finger protein n=1 Tax=Streptomyces mirabilis TaxID=68239 RepID=UPI0035D5D25D